MSSKSLNEQTVDILIGRINRLNPNTTGGWGNLSASGMLFHCTKINNEILNQKIVNKATAKQRFFKIIFYLLTKLPKGVKSSQKYVPEKQSALDFEKEKLENIQTLRKFASCQDPIQGNHPFFGPLNTKEWRRFVWMHTDHHLRQFQV